MIDVHIGRLHIPIIALILGPYLLLATTYGLILPLGEGPDEAPHFTVVRYIVQNGRLPSSEEEHEAFQPPLYYLLGAALTGWVNYEGYVIKANADFSLEPGAPKNLLVHDSAEAFPFRGPALAWHLLRLFSSLCGGVTIWATYRLGRTVFPRRPSWAVGMAALNAFIPEFLFMSGLINNDNLAAALAALLLLQVARLVTGRCNPLTIASLGLLLGLGLLAKVSVGVTALPIVLALIYAARERGGQPWPAVRRAATWGLAVAVIAVLISGWWFARNQILYQDLTGWSFILETNALREGPLTPSVIVWLMRGLFKSFWLSWIGIALDGWIYGLLLVLCLVALAGLIRLVVQRRDAFDRSTWVVLGLLTLQIAVVAGSLLQWTATVLGTDQARLLYPALPALLLLFVLGLAQWIPPRWDGWLVGSLALPFLALATAAPWAYIAPVHAPPGLITRQELQRVATMADVPFGDALRLVGYRLPTGPIQPGQKVELDLYWEALRPISRDLWLTLSIVPMAGQSEQPLVTKDGTPSAGRDTADRWLPGQIIASQHWLSIPQWAPPGPYEVTAGIHPFGDWDWLPAGSEGRVSATLGPLEVEQ